MRDRSRVPNVAVAISAIMFFRLFFFVFANIEKMTRRGSFNRREIKLCPATQRNHSHKHGAQLQAKLRENDCSPFFPSAVVERRRYELAKLPHRGVSYRRVYRAGVTTLQSPACIGTSIYNFTLSKRIGVELSFELSRYRASRYPLNAALLPPPRQDGKTRIEKRAEARPRCESGSSYRKRATSRKFNGATTITHLDICQTFREPR